MKPEEIYFTDIVYTPYSIEYVKKVEEMLRSLTNCSVCGKPLGIDECYLMRPRQFCEMCNPERVNKLHPREEN